LEAGLRLGDFADSLVIVNVAKYLIELRAVSREVLLESISIAHVSRVEKGQLQRKCSGPYCHSRPHSDYFLPTYVAN
jgi:hypothetical protein